MRNLLLSTTFEERAQRAAPAVENQRLPGLTGAAGLGLCALALASVLAAADASQVKAVYLLPMGNSIDQYLANHLVKKNLFQVLADPKGADAVLTDRIGASLETKLAELYPPEKPEEKKDEKKKEAKSAQQGELGGDSFKIPPSSFSRSKGNLFLVDLKSRQVLWSIYQPARDSTPKELNRMAEKISKALELQLRGK
jgi:hypothetical protein